MSEWMPVLLGAVLGAMHRRFGWSRRALYGSGVVAGAVATTLSGEWAFAPFFFVADVLLVGAGILATQAAHRAWAAFTTRRPT